MKYTKVECDECGSEFERPNGRYNEAVRNGWKQFCSKECIYKNKTTSVKVKCENCYKDISVHKNTYERSVSKNFFCGHSCSAAFNNTCRSEELRLKTAKSIQSAFVRNGLTKLPNKNCVVCGNKFKQRKDFNVCCSRSCSGIHRFGSLPLSKDDLINTILEFSKNNNGRTPQKRDMERKVEGAAKKFFGTWNKAVKECGLKPNPSKYQKTRLKCKDGHMADSISEMIVDNWLFDYDIKHERSKKYPCSNCDCDFYLIDRDCWVEYFGLKGQSDEYDFTVGLKTELVKKHGLKFIEILPSDLYPEIKLEKMLLG